MIYHEYVSFLVCACKRAWELFFPARNWSQNPVTVARVNVTT